MKLLLDQGLPRSAAELLRQEGLDSWAGIPKLIGQVLVLCSDELVSGSAVSVRRDGIRIRRLPMISENFENPA